MFNILPPKLEKFKPNLHRIFGSFGDNESYRVTFVLPIYQINDISDEIIQTKWEHAYLEMLTMLAKVVVGSENYWVIRFRPMIIDKYDMIEFRLDADVSIANTKHIEIPQLNYIDPTFKDVFRLWKAEKKYQLRMLRRRIWKK